MNAFDPEAPRELFIVEESAGRAARPHSRAEAQAKLAMTLLMWGTSMAISVLGAALSSHHILVANTLLRLALAALGMAFCYGLHRLLARLAHRPFRFRAIVAAAAAPFVAEIYAWITYFAFLALYDKPIRFQISDWGDALATLSLWTWFFIAWAGLYLAIEYSAEAHHEAERAAELRATAQAAKLRALSNQINPHFLFNSLNSISALILDGRGAEAEQMLSRLSDYFRTTLSIDPLVEVSLEQEFELHRRYLSIEQMRYPDLAVDIALPDALGHAMVPALIIQPLVENAIKHGVAKSRPPTRIAIAAARADAMLEISVVNEGAAAGPAERTDAAPAEGGIGIANVRQRLAEYFGAMQSLTLAATPGGFEARVRLPLLLPR